MFGVKDAFTKLKRSFTFQEGSSTSSLPRSVRGSVPPQGSDRIYNDGDDYMLPIELNGYLPTTKNRLLSKEMANEIRVLMPTRIQLYTEWNLLYSLEQHGSSLNSLYDNVSPKDNTSARVGYVIVIKDKKNGIFGAYSNEYFRPMGHRRYGGNGECFLWKFERAHNVNSKPMAEDLIDMDENEKEKQRMNTPDDERWQFRGYPYTGVNEFALYCTSEFLSMGAGDGHYGLWCDDGLYNGVSYPCQTYGNDPLSQEGKKFHIIGLEVWRVG